MEEGQNFISQKSITVDDLTVTYRNGHTALRSASFSIPEGSITGLVGVNGSGKSTLFKALMGFIPIARGKVSLLGHSLKDALKKNLIAYVPQSEEVDWDFPVLVKDVVLMGNAAARHASDNRLPHGGTIITGRQTNQIINTRTQALGSVGGNRLTRDNMQWV